MEDNYIQKSLSKLDRHRIILNFLADKTAITLKELENSLSCSRITIQRDLLELENKGFLSRVHGGATLKNFDLAAYDHEKRLLIHCDKKKKIARKAVSLVTSDMYIFIDASSTGYFLSELLFPDNVRVVTSGIDTFLNLQKNRNIQAILTGGRMNPQNRTLVGTEAISVIRQFHFDLVFFSADSLIQEKGVFCSDEEAAAVSRSSIENSDKKILLFDSSKIHLRKGAKICDLEIVDTLVTDEEDNLYITRLFGGKIL